MKSRIEHCFSISLLSTVPNIKLLHQLSLLVRDEGIDIQYEHLLDESKPEFREELARIVQSLELKSCWNSARVARDLAKLPPLDVTINQVKHCNYIFGNFCIGLL